MYVYLIRMSQIHNFVGHIFVSLTTIEEANQFHLQTFKLQKNKITTTYVH